jgi:hypothetical protein
METVIGYLNAPFDWYVSTNEYGEVPMVHSIDKLNDHLHYHWLDTPASRQRYPEGRKHYQDCGAKGLRLIEQLNNGKHVAIRISEEDERYDRKTKYNGVWEISHLTWYPNGSVSFFYVKKVADLVVKHKEKVA